MKRVNINERTTFKLNAISFSLQLCYFFSLKKKYAHTHCMSVEVVLIRWHKVLDRFFVVAGCHGEFVGLDSIHGFLWLWCMRLRVDWTNSNQLSWKQKLRVFHLGLSQLRVQVWLNLLEDPSGHSFRSNSSSRHLSLNSSAALPYQYHSHKGWAFILI